MESEKIRDLSTQKFTDYIKKYASYHGYELNPKEYQNSQDRILREYNGKRQELIFFKTLRPLTDPAAADSPKPLDDMPF
jgi:hypothetical protein